MKGWTREWLEKASTENGAPATPWHTLDYAVEARDADNSPLCVELLVSPAWRTADDNPRGVLLRGDL